MADTAVTLSVLMRHGARRPRGARVVGALVAALSGVLALGACAATERPPEVWRRPRTEVQVLGPDGTPEAGVGLGREIYGLGGGSPGVDWERISVALAATDPERAGGAVATAPEDPADAPPGGVDDAPRPQDPPVGGAPAPGASGAAQDPAAAQDPPAVQDPEADEAQRLAVERERLQERLQAEARLRNAFGEAILINDDGTITKQYFLSKGAGDVFLSLLTPLGGAKPAAIQGQQSVGGEQIDTVLGRMLGADNAVSLVYIPDFETWMNMSPRVGKNDVPAKPSEPGSNSLLLVTARPKALAAFESALNLFYANIPQVEIQVKVVEYASGDAVSFGVQQLGAGAPGAPPTFQNLSSGRLIQQITSNFPLNPPLSGAGSTNDRGLITLGGIHDTWELNAVLEALESSNLADIKSQPTMVVRNGGVATVSTLTDQPFPEARISNQTVTTTNVQFRPVGVVMDIRPEIVGTETVVLNVYISVSAVTGFAPTEPIASPIVATREATTSVHLREGQSTVIGGLVQESVFESETKLPILGDIPILGYLFRSTTQQRQKTTLEFLITPQIRWGAQGTRPSGTAF